MIARYLYNRMTGEIGHRWQGPADQLAGNVPPDCACIDADAVIDPQSQRVDIKTAAVVDYKPPAPDVDHEWIDNDEHGRRVRRWVLSQAVADRRRREAEIGAELAALDARLIRPLGELAAYSADVEANLEPRNKARARVDEINRSKETLRAELRRLVK